VGNRRGKRRAKAGEGDGDGDVDDWLHVERHGMKLQSSGRAEAGNCQWRCHRTVSCWHCMEPSS